MTSDASSSGTGGWPGQTGGGGNEPAGQWPQQPQPGWGQQPPAQQPPGWGQQPQRPQQGWGQQPAQPGQPQAGQPQAGQPAQGGQQPAQSQQGWGQQPAQPGRPAGQPASGQWGQQPQQAGSQWGQQGQAQQGWGQQGQQPGTQWGQQPGSQWQQPGSQWGQQGQQQQGWGQQGQQQQGWGQQGWGQPGSQWAPTLPSAWDEGDPWGSDSYPVDVRFTPEGRIGRYWGIPIIGHAVRALCLIPHIIVLALLSILVAIAILFTWIPVLFTGHQARWAYALIGGFLRWSIRVQTWGQLLSGTYPPFTGAEADGQHVRVRIDEDQRINRFWGIPIIGFMVRYVILIPHLIILWVLAIIVWFLMLFAWIPVLINGRQADLIYTLVGGFVRWQTRVGAYLLLLSGPYPPFRLD